MTTEIRVLSETDTEQMYEIINTAAEAYRGLIPDESDTEPYMSMDKLRSEIRQMTFFGAEDDHLLGIIGIQERDDVSLIRHLYVRPTVQQSGIGTQLLERAIQNATADTVLVGTWAAAEWAISFYEKNGFDNLGSNEELLSNYWDIPEYQRSASVVLRRD